MVVNFNMHQDYLTQVLGILLEASIENRAFNTADTAALQEMATIHSLEGGMAVKIARAALNIELEDEGSGSRISYSTPKEELPEIKLWPNPADDFIRLNRTETVNYQPYDAEMRMVLSGEYTGGNIDIQTLKAGYYLLFAAEAGKVYKPVGFCKMK